MTRTTCHILFVLALAIAAKHLPGGSAAPWRLPRFGATALAQDNLIPPGYESNPGAAFDGSPSGASGQNAFAPNNYGPSAPAKPTNPARPGSWPGSAPAQQPGAGSNRPPMNLGAQGTGNVPPPSASAPPPPRKDPAEPPYEPAAILAHVGSEIVQAAEILPTVHQRLDPFVEKLGPEFHDLPEESKQAQIKKWKRELMERTLEDAIRIKLLMSEIRRIADEEAIKSNIDKIREEFNSREIKRLNEFYKLNGAIDLENKLRAQGGSLESQRMVFVERYMAVGWLRQQVREPKEPSHEQMINYYREHTADWERPARARWEQLTANLSEFSSKTEAWRAITAWGRQVQSGTPLAEVAKAHSHGYSAGDGGLNDWTTQGSLRSELIDRTLFGLPVGTLSQIIEDEEGFHIVRVVEREDRHMLPFGEVQPQIKEKLQAGDKQDLMDEYLAKLRKRTPVHTVFDDDAEPIATLPDTTRR